MPLFVGHCVICLEALQGTRTQALSCNHVLHELAHLQESTEFFMDLRVAQGLQKGPETLHLNTQMKRSPPSSEIKCMCKHPLVAVPNWWTAGFAYPVLAPKIKSQVAKDHR